MHGDRKTWLLKNMTIENKDNWDDLRVFLIVARHASLDAAAVGLKQDATTLGRRVRRLEKQFGATLLERSRKGHALTAEGEVLFAQAEQMEHLVAEVQQSIGGEIQQVTGTVRLSVTEAFGNVVIAPALGNFFKNHPGLNIELVATSGFLSVSKREADMAVLLSRPTRGRLKVQKLSDYQLQLYATPDYLNEYGTPNSVEEIQHHTLIGYVDDLIYSPSLRYYDEIGSGLSPTLTSSSLLAQKQLACSNCGIAMLPRFVAEPEPTLVTVLPDEVCITRTFWLAVHEDIVEHARIRAVMDFLLKLVAKGNIDYR
jgi:DNA-binding transcriptional LysR family regulator